MLQLSHIRPFVEGDIPQVADLHRRVFNIAGHSSPELLESYRTYLTQVFLNNPWREDEIGPLVCQENGWKITGFLGVVPRRMSIGGQPVRAGITSQFVVDPDSRGRAGMMLLRAVLSGPQDLSIADESNAACRIVWEGFGGATSFLYSMHWLYPLRPFQLALFLSRRKKLLPYLISPVATPAAWALDALAARILRYVFRPPEPRFLGEELNRETLLSCLAGGREWRSLRMEYDSRSLTWVLERADHLRRNGSLQKVLVRKQNRDIAGWYLYYLNPGGISEVVELHTKPHCAHDVLDHLFYHAWQRGAIGLSGRMEPSLMQAFSDKHCLFHCGPQWVLIHARRPELLHAFERGDVRFSRLDGEWCLHFQ